MDSVGVGVEGQEGLAARNPKSTAHETNLGCRASVERGFKRKKRNDITSTVEQPNQTRKGEGFGGRIVSQSGKSNFVLKKFKTHIFSFCFNMM